MNDSQKATFNIDKERLEDLISALTRVHREVQDSSDMNITINTNDDTVNVEVLERKGYTFKEEY